MKKIVLCLTLLFLIFSCEKEEINDSISTDIKDWNQKDYLSIIKSLGFSGDNIIEYDEYFVIEDDIVIYKKDLITTNLKQARTTYLVSNTIVRNIRVKIDGSLSGWTNIITDALDAWNNVNSKLHFTIVTVSPHITIYADTDAECPSSHKNLGYYVCAMASFPSSTRQPGAIISLNTNSTFMTSTAQRLKVITHEFGHCIGFRHTNWQALGESSAARISYTHSTDSKSLMNGGECGEVKTLSVYDRTALCQLYRNGEVSSGSSKDLDKHRSIYGYCLTNGKAPEDVVAIAIAKSDDHCYVWYDDGTVTSGKSFCLDAFRNSRSYSLAPGKTPNNIVGMGISSDDKCYVWYDDGTVSSGTSRNLDAYRSPYNYSLAPGKTPGDIVGMGISSDDKCYVWYDDGTVSSGTSKDLDKFRSPYNYSLAPGISRNDVVGMGISLDDYCYVWSKQ
jgi:hypothetical protein